MRDLGFSGGVDVSETDELGRLLVLPATATKSTTTTATITYELRFISLFIFPSTDRHSCPAQNLRVHS